MRRDELNRYCEQLPGCRDFLENFFLACEPFTPGENFMNYLSDLESYGRTNRRIHENDAALVDAFFDIVDTGTEDTGVEMPDDPDFSHYVVEGRYAVGEAKEVEHETNGISFGYVRLWGMEDFAEYGSVESRNVISKKALKFMTAMNRRLGRERF